MSSTITGEPSRRSTTSRLKRTLIVIAGMIVVGAIARGYVRSPFEAAPPAILALGALATIWMLLVFRSGSLAGERPDFRPYRFFKCGAGAAVITALLLGSNRAFHDAGGEYAGSAAVLTIAIFVVLAGRRSFVVAKSAQNETGTQRAEAIADIWIPEGLFAVLWREAYIVYLGLAGWLMKPIVPQKAISFSNSRVARPMIIAVLVLSLVELFIIHLFANLLNGTFAMILLVAGMLVAIYILGILRSFSLYPSFISDSVIGVRMTVFYNQDFTWPDIASIEPFNNGVNGITEDAMNAAILVPPNVIVRFNRQISAKRAIKPARDVGAVVFYVDEPAQYIDTANLIRVGRMAGMPAK